jgi:hypothetical protein
MTRIFGDRKMPTDVTKNGFLTNFSRYKIFRSEYINACASDIFWLLVGRFDEVRALPQPAFRSRATNYEQILETAGKREKAVFK